MITLKKGDKAPDFSGYDQDGNRLSLKSFYGKKVVLYFYPKDNTPGCTAEACNLRDNYSMLLDKGYAIIGVSADSPKSHKNFICWPSNHLAQKTSCGRGVIFARFAHVRAKGRRSSVVMAK